MHGFYRVEASKVFCIECKNTLYAVNLHGGYKAGVMHLDAADAVLHQQAAPFPMNSRTVRKECKGGFNLASSKICFFGR